MTSTYSGAFARLAMAGAFALSPFASTQSAEARSPQSANETKVLASSNSSMACPEVKTKPTFRYVLPPNGRAGGYFVTVKPESRASARADGCECASASISHQG